MKHLKTISLVRTDALSQFSNGLFRLFSEFSLRKKDDFGL